MASRINAVLTKGPTKGRRQLPLTIEDFGFGDQENHLVARDGMDRAISDVIRNLSKNHNSSDGDSPDQ